jgi:hypothetical protein
MHVTNLALILLGIALIIVGASNATHRDPTPETASEESYKELAARWEGVAGTWEAQCDKAIAAAENWKTSYEIALEIIRLKEEDEKKAAEEQRETL